MEDNLMEDKLSLEYVAGLFDGEGCVNIVKSKRKGYKNYYFQVWVAVYNSYKPVLEKLEKQFGGFVIPQQKHKDKSHHLTKWRWGLSGKETIEFLKQILPYTVIKTEQIKLAIEFKENFINGRWSSEEERIKQFESRNSYYKRIAALKKKDFPICHQQRLNERAQQTVVMP